MSKGPMSMSYNSGVFGDSNRGFRYPLHFFKGITEICMNILKRNWEGIPPLKFNSPWNDTIELGTHPRITCQKLFFFKWFKIIFV